MIKYLRFLSISWAILLVCGSQAQAQSLDFSFLSCFTQSTPSASISLSASDAQRISIGIGSQYYTEPKCYHHIVQFAVPSNAGTDLPTGFPYYTLHKEFSFDSLVNELIDTQAKCTSYAQQTIVFRKRSGQWSVMSYSQLKGSWSNNKCKVIVMPGYEDFRARLFQPNPSATDYYRVASRVTTGSSSTLVPRGVCVGLRFADIQDVPQSSCAMPE